MIKRKVKEQSNKKYTYWSTRNYGITQTSDMKEMVEQMNKDLIHYIEQHPELSLVSHTFIHDSSASYYDWVLNAVFIKK